MDSWTVMPVFWALRIPPHKPGTAINPYTIPVVQLPDGRYVMESHNNAHDVERLCPEPKAHLDDPVYKRLQKAWIGVIVALQAVLVPRMLSLSRPTIDYHRNVRKATFGMTLEEYEAKEGEEKGWAKGGVALEVMAEILNERAEGPFCLGDTPSYADFIIVGLLEWSRVLGGDCLQRVYEVDPTFEKLYQACGPWLARNDQ